VAFLLGLLVDGARQRDVLLAVSLSALVMFTLWLGGRGFVDFPLARRISWPWYSMIGCGITLAVGWASSRISATSSGTARPAPPR
jgi:hypothetical protein